MFHVTIVQIHIRIIYITKHLIITSLEALSMKERRLDLIISSALFAEAPFINSKDIIEYDLLCRRQVVINAVHRA